MPITPATLFVACYGKRGSAGMDSLFLALQKKDSLNLQPEQEHGIPDMFENPETGDALMRIQPAKPHDTTVLHLDLPIIPETRPDWAASRRVLETIISNALLLDQDVWGYTLVYVAVWQDDAPAPPAPLRGMLPAARRLGVTVYEAPPYILAETTIAGGHMGLFAIPADDSAGYGAANIYGVAVPAASESVVMGDVLFGSAATLLIPDMLSHKGSFMMRQYRTDGRIQRYKDLINCLHQETDGAMQHVPLGEDQPIPSPHTPDYTILFTEYTRLMRLVPTFQWLHSELETQVINSKTWVAGGYIGDGEDGTLERYHHQRLQSGYAELGKLIKQGQEMLEVAGRTVGLVQAQREQERLVMEQDRLAQQERLTLLFTVLGVALATAEFITADVVADILQLVFGISITEETVGVLVLLPVAGQLLIMAVIGGMAWVVGAWWQRRGRGRG